MDMDDKFSIKNILFTKSLPNYDIPVPVNGHKIFPCIDCGDKFMFESSYNDHLNRKSMQITYICRFCNQTKLFFNRCRLLFHIRSHSFKTATINVNDLKVEPLPLGFVTTKPIKKKKSNPLVIDITKKTQNNGCFECKQKISITYANYKDRVDHFMQYTNEVHSCPVCLFALPTLCGLRAHLRFHLNRPPFVCPECGINLPAKNVTYPYGHDCEGFKMMRATTRLKCPVPNCHLFHPNDFREHMKENHLKKVYKCPYCVVACFNEVTMNKHLLEEHNIVEPKALFYHQCELCPGRLVLQNNIDNHLRTHTNAHTFPCWACGSTFKDVCVLLNHHQQKHGTNDTIAIKNMLSSTNESENQQGNVRRIYRVVKRCDMCKRNFTYKCNFDEISVLPNECPFKCSQSQSNFKTVISSETLLTCHLCKEKISQNWEEIKNHYAKNHKMHKCLDTKVVLKKIDVTKYNIKKTRVRNATTRKVKPRKRQQLSKVKTVEHESVKPVTSDAKIDEKYCTICEYTCETKEQLETHFISHKDPCMAYQCMECGQSFVVKPSFSTHLVLEHGISNVEEYILNKNRCYNEIALEKYQNSNISFEPLKENQCKICREQFDNSEDLAKHFRGHGMAFLLKSTSNKNLP